MHDRLKSAVQELATADDLEIFFLLPFTGGISLNKLERKRRVARTHRGRI